MMAKVTAPPKDLKRMKATFTLDIKTELGATVEGIPMDWSNYDPALSKIINEYERRSLVQSNYGYAITAHRAQGSEYNKVLLFPERIHGVNFKRWLYTAVTRASEFLLIAIDERRR